MQWRHGHIWTLIVVVLAASGCLSNAGTAETTTFDLPLGAVVQYVDSDDASRTAALSWAGVGPALDAFGQERTMLRMTDGNVTHIVDPSRRMAPVTHRDNGTDLFIEFDRVLTGRSLSLADLLLLAAGRDWDTDETFAHRWNGQDLTAAGHWDGNILKIQVRGAPIPAEATFHFSGSPYTLSTLVSIDVVQTVGQKPLQRSFTIGPTTNQTRAVMELPDNSTRAGSPLSSQSLDAFLEGPFPPMTFSLSDAWATLSLDPRMAVAMADDPWLRAAYYSGGPRSASTLDAEEHEWRLTIQTAGGESHRAVVLQTSAQDTVINRRVSSVVEETTPSAPAQPQNHSWATFVDLCGLHTGTTAAEVTAVEFAGSLGYETFHRLRVAFAPEDDVYGQVQCLFDTIEGRPLAASTAPAHHPLCLSGLQGAGTSAYQGPQGPACLLGGVTPQAHLGTKG